MRLGNAAPRRGWAGTVGVAALTIAAMLAGAAHAQVTVPKYRSPIEAPAPQSAALPTPPPITTNASVVEYPVARVNDAIIDNSDYERAQKQLEAEAQQMNMPPAQLAEERRNVLRDLIDTQLLLSRGKELEINADAEVIRRMDAVRKEYHFDTMEDLQKAVRETGTSFEDYQANIKNQVITQEVIGEEVGRKLTLTAKEEQAYYDQHKQEFAQPEQVRLSEILIPTPDDATDEQIAQAQAKADQVAAKLKTGAKFEDLAKQYSGGQTASQGGDLGEFKRGALAKVLEDQTFSLKPGEFTAPIRTRQGFVVLEVTEHTPAGIPPLSAIDEQLKQAIYEQAMGPALRTYLTGLREKAFINIEQGFVDTGASPHQTKAVFAEATPPPVKKKSEQKERMERAELAKPDVPSAKPAVATGATAPGPTVAAGSAPSATASGPTAATAAPVATGKKRTKIHREKIRYGQAPRKSLPAAPEETLTPGADQGVGGTASALPAPGAQMDLASSNTADANADPLGAAAAARGKTRFSDRAATEAKTKAETKAAKVQQKAALTPSTLTPEEQATQKVQSAALGLNGDTTPKKKKTKVKGAPKERIQEQPPAPPKPAPEATPIPPKSVRDNGEPVVSPPPGNLPPVTVPGAAPANSTPAPPPQ
jgi:peptidyl-prolyl cis-trans isomerase SurA